MPKMKEGPTPAARAASLAFAAAMAGVSPGAAVAGQLASPAAPPNEVIGPSKAQPDLHARVEAAAKRLRSERPMAMPEGAPPVRQVQWRNR